MREWSLKSTDPLVLVFAADARLVHVEYPDDQIWEVSIGAGDPPALAVQTTYGLRCKMMRIFSRFSENDHSVLDPEDFIRSTTIRSIYPNYLDLDFSPLPDIDVHFEFWVPESKACTGRYSITNRGSDSRKIKFELASLLTPTEGQRMAPDTLQASLVLTGTSEKISPVIFLVGGSEGNSSPYPCLTLQVELNPGEVKRLIWSQAALSDPDNSLILARQIAAKKWEAELARIQMFNSSQVEIFTGDIDWDAAFMLSQKQALSLFHSASEHLPHPSFLITRQPDQGYSIRGDGSDYNYLWNGQSPLEAFYLLSIILPCAPDLAKAVLLNYLAVQQEDGQIDWKPGLAGQRSILLATPILAHLAWRIYEYTNNREFLETVFPGLMKFLESWFLPDHDQDHDGVPEWSNPLQIALDEHPTYSRWHDWDLGVEIGTTESPGLAALLYQECCDLMSMAQVLSQDEVMPFLHSTTEQLRNFLQMTWDSNTETFVNVDRDSHAHIRTELIGERRGSGVIEIGRHFDKASRIHVNIKSMTGTKCNPRIIIYGTGASGYSRIEQLSEEQIKWYPGRGVITGDRVYLSVDQIEIQALGDEDLVSIYTAGFDYQDISSLLPLWVGFPSNEIAHRLISKTITNPSKFWHPFGLSTLAIDNQHPENSSGSLVNNILTTMVGEGLVRYGYHDIALELVSRIMNGVILNLKKHRSFRRNHHAISGQGSGEYNAISGLAPLNLFLQTLGLTRISQKQIALSGFNPYPWPVTVKYRGVTILCQKNKTLIIFPDGQTVTVDDPSPRVVSLEY